MSNIEYYLVGNFPRKDFDLFLAQFSDTGVTTTVDSIGKKVGVEPTNGSLSNSDYKSSAEDIDDLTKAGKKNIIVKYNNVFYDINDLGYIDSTTNSVTMFERNQKNNFTLSKRIENFFNKVETNSNFSIASSGKWSALSTSKASIQLDWLKNNKINQDRILNYFPDSKLNFTKKNSDVFLNKDIAKSYLTGEWTPSAKVSIEKIATRLKTSPSGVIKLVNGWMSEVMFKESTINNPEFKNFNIEFNSTESTVIGDKVKYDFLSKPDSVSDFKLTGKLNGKPVEIYMGLGTVTDLERTILHVYKYKENYLKKIDGKTKLELRWNMNANRFDFIFAKDGLFYATSALEEKAGKIVHNPELKNATVFNETLLEEDLKNKKISQVQYDTYKLGVRNVPGGGAGGASCAFSNNVSEPRNLNLSSDLSKVLNFLGVK